MTDINQLSSTDTLNAGDLVPVWKTNNGDTRKASMSVLQAYMQNALTFPSVTGVSQFVPQYASPVATGFTVTLNSNSNNQWLILSPTGAFAAGTITFPALANVVDNQEIIVVSTQAITALTINGNGATVIGAPATVSQYGSFRFKFNALGFAWYRLDEDSPAFSAFGLSLINDADATAGRATLGVVIGTDVQGYDADLAALAANSTNGLLTRTGAGTVAARSVAAGTGLAVTNGDGVSGNPTVAAAGRLLEVAGLTPTDSNFIVGNGTAFVAESGATARTSMGVGTTDNVTFLSAATEGANGEKSLLGLATQTVSMSGATATATNLIPANTLLLGVTFRITTEITLGGGGTTFDVGDGTDADAFAATVSTFTVGHTQGVSGFTITSPKYYGSATSVVFTPDSGTFTAGAVRVTAHYMQITAPTS